MADHGCYPRPMLFLACVFLAQLFAAAVPLAVFATIRATR